MLTDLIEVSSKQQTNRLFVARLMTSSTVSHHQFFERSTNGTRRRHCWHQCCPHPADVRCKFNKFNVFLTIQKWCLRHASRPIFVTFDLLTPNVDHFMRWRCGPLVPICIRVGWLVFKIPCSQVCNRQTDERMDEQTNERTDNLRT